MMSTGIKQMLRAFDNVNPVVRFKEVYLACLSPIEVDYTSGRLPPDWNSLDFDGAIATEWRKLLPEHRITVYKVFSSWDGVVSSDSRNRLLAIMSSFSRVSKSQVSPVQPLPIAPADFPSEWVSADASSRLRRIWARFTDREKAAAKKRANGTRDFDELWDCFQAISQHQSDITVVGQTEDETLSSLSEAALTSAESSVGSSEDFFSNRTGTTRIVQEVVNVRYDRKKDILFIQVRLEDKGRKLLEWINAANAIQPEALSALKAAMVKVGL